MSGYRTLDDNGVLAERSMKLHSLLKQCTLCPRSCGVNRLADEKGFCQTGRRAVVSGYCVHRGEEPPISGVHGSGTIFFSYCNLSCIFCQNYQISHEGAGQEVSAEELAAYMLSLQKQGCHNINVVSPSHVIAQIVEALVIAARDGLRIPLVYNSNGYDSVEVLQLLDGIIDVYLPDFKYASDDTAIELSQGKDYTHSSQAAIREMFRQVGMLACDEAGVASRGLLIRHLVLPHGLAGSREVLAFVAEELSPDVHMSIMSQYHPSYEACHDERIGRRLLPAEYKEVIAYAEKYGIMNAYIQHLESSDTYVPDFNKPHPFED